MIRLIPVTKYQNIKLVLDIVNKYSGLVSKKRISDNTNTVYFFVVASVDNEEKPVGITGYRAINSWLVEIVNTVIFPDYRGKGFGVEVTKSITNILFSMGFGKIFSTVRLDNQVMLNIKNNLGFKAEGILKEHYGPNRDIVVFSKLRSQ